jgi:hypothetical protein
VLLGNRRDKSAAGFRTKAAVGEMRSKCNIVAIATIVKKPRPPIFPVIRLGKYPRERAAAAAETSL